MATKVIETSVGGTYYKERFRNEWNRTRS